jgi:hypothetical protein
MPEGGGDETIVSVGQEEYIEARDSRPKEIFPLITNKRGRTASL